MKLIFSATTKTRVFLFIMIIHVGGAENIDRFRRFTYH